LVAAFYSLQGGRMPSDLARMPSMGKSKKAGKGAHKHQHQHPEADEKKMKSENDGAEHKKERVPEREDGSEKEGKQLINYKDLKNILIQMTETGVVSVEDPFAETDLTSWQDFVATEGAKLQIVGDDLLCSDMAAILQAHQDKRCNALMIKLNQIGTVWDAIAVAEKARAQLWGIIVSQRSGETEDDFIADFAVGVGAGQIKCGAPCRSDRMTKYNQLLRIEEQLGERAKYPGRAFREAPQQK